MSRYFPNEFIDQLKKQSRLVDIASSYLSLEKVGPSNYIARCPFHNDVNPSFQINGDTNTFYCHACAAGSSNHSHVKSSDIISFVRHMENINFNQAVEAIANYFNITLPNMSPKEQQEYNQKRQWTDYCSQAHLYFKQNLRENQKSLLYLGNRGITDLDIEIWGLGFGGNEPPQEFSNVRNRIVFPLHDYFGDLISFTGRVPFSGRALKDLNAQRKEMQKGNIPKYRDRKEVDKGNHLYGMHIAKEHIRKYRTAIIVEGWTDVISLHRHGANHAVSTMGVALSETQINLLKRAGAEKVIIMRDSDEAGIMATDRDAKLLEKHNVQCFVLALENGLDPDDLCLQHGYFNEGLNRFIQKHIQPIDQYKITKIYKETQEDILYHYDQINSTQTERLDKVIEVLMTIQDPIELDLYIRQVSDLFVISYDSITQRMNMKKSNQQPVTVPNPVSAFPLQNQQTVV